MSTSNRFLHVIAVALCLALLVLLTGCTASSGGFPARSDDEAADRRALEVKYASAARITQHYALEEGKRRDDRDDVVNGRMALIDSNYKTFVREFVLEKQEADTATDIAVIGLGTAGAIISPSSTTRVLAGISGGITGSKASFDKNYYFEQTAKALYTAMNAQRKEVRARILNGLTDDQVKYPLSQALADLDDYYFAGTFLGALQAIQRDAGVKDATAQRSIDVLRGKVTHPPSVNFMKQVELLAVAIQNKVPGLSLAKCEELIKAIDKDAPTTAWASMGAVKEWLINRQGENRSDEAKADTMFRAFKDAGLIDQ
ncbi:MAG: hypothetical protein AABZ53_12400 [Planctomycetota bacterium]